MAEAAKAAGNRVRRRRLDAALAEYTRAIELDPDLLAAFNNRAQTHLKLNKPLAAEADADEVVRREPGNVKALLRRAAARQAPGCRAAALEDVHAALAREPGNQQARAQLRAMSGEAPAPATAPGGPAARRLPGRGQRRGAGRRARALPARRPVAARPQKLRVSSGSTIASACCSCSCAFGCMEHSPLCSAACPAAPLRARPSPRPTPMHPCTALHRSAATCSPAAPPQPCASPHPPSPRSWSQRTWWLWSTTPKHSGRETPWPPE
jgi:hypothetical protein